MVTKALWVDSGFAEVDSVECAGSKDTELGSIAEDVDEDCSVCDSTDDCVVEVGSVGWRDEVSNEITEEDTDVVTSNADVVTSNADVVTSNADVVTSNADVVRSDELEVRSNELVVTSDDSVVVSDEPKVTSDKLVVTSKASVVTSKASVVTSDELEVVSDKLVVTTDDLVVTSDVSVVTIDDSVLTPDKPVAVVTSISSIVVVNGVVSKDVNEVIEDKVVCVVSEVESEVLDDESPAVVDIEEVVDSRELVSSVTAAVVAVVVSFVRLRACGAPLKSPELGVLVGGELVDAKSFENSASSQLVGFKPRLRISTTEDILPNPLKKYCKKLRPI